MEDQLKIGNEQMNVNADTIDTKLNDPLRLCTCLRQLHVPSEVCYAGIRDMLGTTTEGMILKNQGRKKCARDIAGFGKVNWIAFSHSAVQTLHINSVTEK